MVHRKKNERRVAQWVGTPAATQEHRFLSVILFLSSKCILGGGNDVPNALDPAAGMADLGGIPGSWLGLDLALAVVGI